MIENIPASWLPYLKDEFTKDYFKKLCYLVDEEYKIKTVYPARENIFRALELCPLDKVRVVIIGQDPYHGKGQAHGLSFSVMDGVPLPPSLKNIYKVVYKGNNVPISGNLERWAQQGVLLLNAVLTVEKGKAGSHKKLGWQEFTDAIIRIVSENCPDAVYLLWGNYAKQKASKISVDDKYILHSSHPSPFSFYRGFSDCDHFNESNNLLVELGEHPINW